MPEHILQIEAELERENADAGERLRRILPFILGTVNTRASLEGELADGFVWAGQTVGLIHDVPTAQELIERMVSEAYSLSVRMRGIFQE